MKFLCPILLILVSCAHQRKLGEIRQESSDTFKEESFLRYSEGRLEKRFSDTKNPVIYCHQGEYELGFNKLREQYSERNESELYWNDLGICHFLKKDLIKAQHYFERAYSIKKAAPILNNLGVLAMKRQFFSQALQYFKLAQKESEVLTSGFNQAQLFIQFRLYTKARTILLSLHQKNKNDVDILISLSSIELFNKKPEKALKYLNSVSGDYREREDFRLNKALALTLLGKFKEASDFLNQQAFYRFRDIKKRAQKLVKYLNRKLKEQEELANKVAKK
jgi:tetratricopeptide (TPR) repeat protein